MLPVTISASRTESVAPLGLLVARPRLKTAMLDLSCLTYRSRSFAPARAQSEEAAQVAWQVAWSIGGWRRKRQKYPQDGPRRKAIL
jgi:hypothetical protein